MATRPYNPGTPSSAVRRNAPSAALSAALLLFLGLYLGMGADPPDGWDLRLKIGSWGTYYTLLIGGGLMVLAALLLLTGRRVALLIEAVASASVGTALIAFGLLLVIDVTFHAFVLILLGAFSLKESYRGWSTYRWLALAAGVESASIAACDQARVHTRPEPMVGSAHPTSDPVETRRVGTAHPASEPAETRRVGTAHPVAEPAEPAEGYLAAFADDSNDEDSR